MDGRATNAKERTTKNDLHFPNISFNLKQIEIHKMATTSSAQIRTKETYSRKWMLSGQPTRL